VRRLYDWVLEWASSRYALAALLIVAFTESSFFPVPPDVLLITMAMAAPARGFVLAAWCTVASVAGGVLGYYIGLALMDVIGCRLVSLYNGIAVFDWLAGEFTTYNFWAVFIAAVTPIPYKIFTITAGAVEADFGTFLLASALGRPVRFFAVAALIYWFGPPVKRFIDRYFNLLSVVFVVLLIGGFALVGLRGKGNAGAPSERAPGSHYVRICAE
jgi:membrane protein YqaA with SNARE-associated domain